MSYPPGFPGNLSIADFSYSLPDDKIALYPLPARENAKLLVWKGGQLAEGLYSDLPDFLPHPSLLVFNDSRVIEARLFIPRPGGGHIEIFCLGPYETTDPARALQQTGKILWTCLIGGASKWKKEQPLEKNMDGISLQVRFVEKRKEDFVVEFSWSPQHLPFVSVLHTFGTIPLPPYLKRAADHSDAERYQTLYARAFGSVAAPTAGLHFSASLLQSLQEKKIDRVFLTLHVGAGTFMPVKTEKIGDHHMHAECIEVGAAALENLILNLSEPVIAVGTTSLRTLESLYWLGLSVYERPDIQGGDLHVDSWKPYRPHPDISTEAALSVLLSWVRRQPDQKLIADTRLFIVPGYSFKIVRGLVTNFHQPQSTLLLLVAALTGAAWKSVYAYALANDYRFLSYGDGCLFLP